jgi:hypothetical protein
VTHLVANRDLVEDRGRIDLSKGDALDVLHLPPRARGARHHRVRHCENRSRVRDLGTLRPEGAHDAAGLRRLVPLRVEGELRLAQSQRGRARKSGAGHTVSHSNQVEDSIYKGYTHIGLFGRLS